MPLIIASLRPWTRLSLMIAIGAGAAGCSADTSRFSDSAFSNPFNGQTASRAEPAYAAPAAYRSAPGSQISSQPLAAPYQAPAAYGSAPTYNTASYGSAPTPSPMPAYNAPAYTPPSYTPPSYTQHRPEAAGLLPPPTRPELSRTTGYGGNASYAPRAQTGSAMHTVNRGETLGSIARRYDKSPDEVARANRLAVGTRVQAGQRLVIPNVQASEAPRVPETKLADKPERLQKVASLEPVANARVAAPAAEPAADDKNDASGNAAFRWPVRGRVIAGFGAKTNGQQNDGINVAVPEGTAIKSAEDGVVAYAGNELKGYGNLVLVRHANGFVTAYAHASELTVKRGDQVRRGQVLGKAGQTGNVNSPQLHFEIRKGSTPVDPMQFLASTS